MQRGEPIGDGEGGIARDHAGCDGELLAVLLGDPAEAAARQAGVDPEDKHAFDSIERPIAGGGCATGSALLEGVEDLVGDVEVGGDELDVVVVLEQVEEMEHLARARRVRHLDRRRRQPLRLGRVDRDPGGFQRGLERRGGRSARTTTSTRSRRRAGPGRRRRGPPP